MTQGAAEETAAAISPRRRQLVIAASLLALFLGALDALVMSAAMPTVVADLGGLDLFSWVYSAYLLTRTVALPIFGKLADIYPTRKSGLFQAASLQLHAAQRHNHPGRRQQPVPFRTGAGKRHPALRPAPSRSPSRNHPERDGNQVIHLRGSTLAPFESRVGQMDACTRPRNDGEKLTIPLPSS